MPPPIPGLRYYAEYLDKPTHDALLAAVDANPWQSAALGSGAEGRAVQIYGYTYHHTMGGIYRIGNLPDWAHQVAVRLWRDGLTLTVSDQLVANDYPAGSGIFGHVDLEAFDDTIVSLSLSSTCVMQFTEHGSRRLEEWLLEPRSALVLAGAARHNWTHGIPARHSDRWMGRDLPRARRVSLTFRTMRPAAVDPP